MNWISRFLPMLLLRRFSVMTTAGLLTAAGALSGNAVDAATLPVPCAPGVCGVNNTPGFKISPGGFVTSGAATAVQSGNTLTVAQTSNQAILNWLSFNVSADGRVV